MLRAKRLASISGDCIMRCRNVRRNSSSLGRSSASWATMAMYCSGVSAANSFRSKLHNWLQPARPTIVLPGIVRTGTPIQNASRLVVCPLQGRGSRPRSTVW